MQADTGNGTITAMQTAFVQKYDEPISEEKLTELTAKYSSEVVATVIDQMKPDAYEAVNYLVKCLTSGWYQSPKAESGKGKGKSKKGGISSEATKTLKFTWNYKMEQGWISKDERDYMLDIFLNGTKADEEKTRDISFRCLQGMYPNAPTTWFYWLPFRERRITANTWIAKSGREDLTPYEVT